MTRQCCVFTWGHVDSVFALQGVGGNSEHLSFVAILCLHLGKEGGCKSGRSWLPDHTAQLVAARDCVVQSLFEVLMEVQEAGEELMGQTKTTRCGKQA